MRLGISFYLAAHYNVADVFFEFSVTRIVLSFLVLVLMVNVFPGFIGVSNEERQRMIPASQLVTKTLGVIILVVTLGLWRADQRSLTHHEHLVHKTIA